VALTWPLLPRAGRDVPGDLIDPLFTCWALGWNFHALGLTDGGPRPVAYWDANIFFPAPATLARSEHFLTQSVLGLPVFAPTRDLVLTYNILFLSTFLLSALFLYLLAHDETGDHGAALGAGLFYGFALFRWEQVAHLGALSSQWMPLALLAARRVAQGGPVPRTATWMAALAAATSVQMAASGYYLLFFPPFLAAWAAVEAARVGRAGAWARLGLSGAVAAVLALPVVLPYVRLRAGGAARDLGSVVEHSADLLSWVTAPTITRLWGPILDVFPRGEARLFPGLVTPLLALIGLAAAVRAVSASLPRRDAPPDRGRRAARVAAAVLAAAGVVALAAALAGGRELALGPLRARAFSGSRPLVMLAASLALALAAWPRLRPLLGRLLARREVIAVALALVAAWLSLGPLVTRDGWPTALPAPYRVLYEHVPGFDSGRAPARFAMVAACFGALAAAWGLRHLRASARGRRVAGAACVLFLVETAPVPLPLSRQWPMEGVADLPVWRGGEPSPIVAAVRALPDDAVLAQLPFREMFHEARYMFDSTFHWRRMLNGYSSWMPEVYVETAFAARDPLRQPAEALAALRAAGATHIVVHERAWREPKGARVSERLVEAGARPVARAGDMTLLAVR
jgi:hypothetical protein